MIIKRFFKKVLFYLIIPALFIPIVIYKQYSKQNVVIKYVNTKNTAIVTSVQNYTNRETIRNKNITSLPVENGNNGSNAVGGSVSNKYFLSAVIVVRIYKTDKAKWSREDLRQWIRYMQFAGAEHVYLYDHYKEVSECLKEWYQTHFKPSEITYTDWSSYHKPHTGSHIGHTQVPGYNHALNIARQTSDWQIAFDMDEYPFAPSDTKPGFLTRFIKTRSKLNPNIAEFSIKNILFLGKRSSNKYVIEQVLRRTGEPANGLDKPIYNIKCTKKCGMHHNSLQCGQSVDVNPNDLRNNHYWHARLQDWGEDTPKVLNMTIYDSSALAIAEQFKTMTV